ncbi:MAG: TonB family protein [Gammaproteobacteria bacterium]|nr:TonB family protein [Gammaproteobacteria bacterium]
MNTLMEFIVLANVILSLVVLAVLFIQRVTKQWSSCLFRYQLWFTLPMALLASALWPDNDAFYQVSPVLNSYIAPSIEVLLEAPANTPALAILYSIGATMIAGLMVFQIWQLYRCPNVKSAAPYRVKQQKKSFSPAIFGVIKPTLWLPQDFENNYSTKQKKLILLHEVTHWQSRDPWFNILASIIFLIAWWNPLCWLALKHYQRDQELACDEKVCHQLPREEYSDYATLILEKSSGRNRPLVSQWAQQSLVKERIMNIKNNKLRRGATSLSLVVASVLALSIGAVSQESQTSLEPTSVVHPMYPIEAAKNGIEGFVTFEFDTDDAGRPTNLTVVKASHQDLFQNEAKAAISQWTFSAKGKKSVQYTLEFSLGQ